MSLAHAVRQQPAHVIRNFLTGGSAEVPAQVMHTTTFRCAHPDGRLRPPPGTPSCTVHPTGALTWASIDGSTITALFEDSSVLTLYTSLAGDYEGSHTLHAVDRDPLGIHPFGSPFQNRYQALSGRYTLAPAGERLRLTIDELELLGRSVAPDTAGANACLLTIDHLEVDMRRPVGPSPPACEGVELEWPPFALLRDDQPGAWVDESSAPLLYTKAPWPRLRLRLRVPPRSGRYPIGDMVELSLEHEERTFHGVSGLVRIELHKSGALFGGFENLRMRSDDADPCDVRPILVPVWTTKPPAADP